MTPPSDFRVLQPAQFDEWDRFVNGPTGRMQQTTWWAQSLDSFGVPFDVVGQFRAGQLVGGALIRSARAPWLGVAVSDCTGGPLLDTTDPAAPEAFLDVVAEVARRRRSVRITFRKPADAATFDALGAALTRRRERWIEQPEQSEAMIDLAGRTVDDVVAGFRQNARQSLRKGQRGPLVVKSLRTRAEVREAYATFAATASRKGFALRPGAAAEPLLLAGIERDRGELIGALLDGRVVAAIYVSFVGSEAVYEYGGFLADAAPAFPNHVLHLAAITSAIDRGVARYNLGQLSRRDPMTGVDAFKRSLGAVRHENLPRTRWDTRPLLAGTLDRVRSQQWGRDLIKRLRRDAMRRGAPAADTSA